MNAKHPVLQILLFAVCVLSLAGVCIFVSSPTSFNPVSAAPVLVGPTLSIPLQIPATPNSIVTVPVNFAANGTSIASMIFSIDYDQSYLYFDETVPSAITLYLPANYQGNCSADLSDTDGEIDCTILYPLQQLPPLPDGQIAAIKLRTLNPGYTVDARVGYSNTPPVSFGNTAGQSEPGNAIEGSVRIVTTVTATPSQTPTSTPTPTASSTPTLTPTYTLTPATPISMPRSFAPIVFKNYTSYTCLNLLLNASFEDNTGWEIPATEYPAGYVTSPVHSGLRSMRTGIEYFPHNRYSYSSVRQMVTIPTSFDWVRLYFWRYAVSGEAAARPDEDLAQALPPQPQIGLPFGETSLSGYDVHYVLILDANNHILETLVWGLYNQPSWVYYERLLNDYAGRTIKIQFGTYNDGYGGISAMYVDDVFVEVCQ